MKEQTLHTVCACLVGLGAWIGYGEAASLTIYQLDADGTATVFDPGLDGWSLTPDASGAAGTSVESLGGGSYSVHVGTNVFGAAESDLQASAIYGAGVHLPEAFGYRIEFTTDLATYDSYNLDSNGDRPGFGLFDLFTVNLNSNSAAGFYWEQVNGGSGLLPDPLMIPLPLGVPSGPGSHVTLLSGVNWFWGGANQNALETETSAVPYVLELTHALPELASEFWLSFVLDTATLADADTLLPSWGTFNSGDGPLDPGIIPEPAAILLLGMGLCGIAIRRLRAYR